MMTAKITGAATARSDRRPSQNLPPTVRRSPRLSQNQPPTDKGLDVPVPEGGDSLKKRKRSAQNDGDGKQKESSAFKQQQVERQHLLRKENRRIKERCKRKKRKRSAQNDGDGKQKESSAFKQQQVERKQLLREENRRIRERRKRKRSAQNDGDGKQKESSAFMQQQVERQQLLREENRRIRERRGFDFGDIPPIGIDGRLFESCWAEKSLYPAPKVYEDMAKIGLKSYNRQFDTSYQFTKILRVYFFQTLDNCTHNLIFCRGEDKSVASPEDFMLTGSSISGVAMVSSCMKEKDLRYYTGLDGWRSRCIVYEYYVLRDHK